MPIRMEEETSSRRGWRGRGCILKSVIAKGGGGLQFLYVIIWEGVKVLIHHTFHSFDTHHTLLGLRKFDHISEGLRSLRRFSVKDGLEINHGVMVFKCLNNFVPKYSCDKFQMRSAVSICR